MKVAIAYVTKKTKKLISVYGRLIMVFALKYLSSRCSIYNAKLNKPYNTNS